MYAIIGFLMGATVGCLIWTRQEIKKIERDVQAIETFLGLVLDKVPEVKDAVHEINKRVECQDKA